MRAFTVSQLWCKELPSPPLIHELEKLFQADLSNVRFYELDREPAEGVAALAGNGAVFFSPGQSWSPRPDELRRLTHELAHLLQQRRSARREERRVQLLWDPHLEAEADAWSRRAVRQLGSRWLGNSRRMTASGTNPPSRRMADVLEPSLGLSFQPFLKMAINRAVPRSQRFANGGWNINEQDYQLVTDYDDAARRVTGLMRLQGSTGGERQAALAVLQRWMGLTLAGTVLTTPGAIVRAFGRDAAALARMAIGRQAELKYFNNYGELASALLGEVRSEPLALYETALGKAVLRTPWVAQQLRNLAQRLVAYWDGVYTMLHGPGQGTLGYSRGEPWMFRGNYWQYHYYTTPLSGLKKANQNTISTNVAVLHDMMEFIKDKAGASHLHRNLQWIDPTGHAIDIEKRDMRNNLGTVNEAYPLVRAGRRLRYPMQAGPSFTVSQMLSLADAASATQNEKAALAYAIFAFWNQVYQRECTPIHTYYEVMVAAANYGVPFTANQSPRQNAPGAVAAVLDQVWLHGMNPPLH